MLPVLLGAALIVIGVIERAPSAIIAGGVLIGLGSLFVKNVR